MNINQTVAKWTPLMVGLEEAKTARCAWVFEYEVTYLKSFSEGEQERQLGAPIKLVFPVLRRAVALLDNDTTEYAHVHAAVSRAVQECAETAADLDPGDWLAEEEQSKLAAGLADRMHTALLTFPGGMG